MAAPFLAHAAGHCPFALWSSVADPLPVLDVESHAGESITGDLMTKAW
jgi:hypothetical protein